MRVNPQPDTLGRSLIKGAAQYGRAVEKACPASALGRDQQFSEEPRQKKPTQVQADPLCQAGTESFDPKWEGPRLLPTFVTQLLGQVMPERRNRVALETAYGTAPLGRQALLVDRRS